LFSNIFLFASFYQTESCAANTVVFARGVTNNACNILDTDKSAKYSFPSYISYDATATCSGTPSASINLDTASACVPMGSDGADGDAVDPINTANTFQKFNLVQYFPENPIYLTTQVFDNGCGTPLTSVESTLTGVCFSNGVTSQKYSCSKLLIIILL
jgi:hypothetical protein